MDTIFRITCEFKNPQIIVDLKYDFEFIDDMNERDFEYNSSIITINDIVINNDEYNARHNILSLIRKHFCRIYKIGIEDVQICNSTNEPSVPYILFCKEQGPPNFCQIVKIERIILKIK